MQKLKTKLKSDRSQRVVGDREPWTCFSRETQMTEKKEAQEEIGKQRKIKIYTSEMTCETKKRGVSRSSLKTEDEPHPGSITNKRLNCVGKEREKKKGNQVKSPVVYSAKGKCVSVRVDIPIFGS